MQSLPDRHSSLAATSENMAHVRPDEGSSPYLLVPLLVPSPFSWAGTALVYTFGRGFAHARVAQWSLRKQLVFSHHLLRVGHAIISFTECNETEINKSINLPECGLGNNGGVITSGFSLVIPPLFLCSEEPRTTLTFLYFFPDLSSLYNWL